MSVAIRTSQNVLLEYQPVSIGDRILASLLDYGVIISWLMLMFWLPSSVGRTTSSFYVVLVFLPIVFYDLVSEWFLNGQSLGKIALKIRVVMLDGSQPGLGAYLLRWVFRLIETVAFFGGAVPIITAAINGKGQRLGDIAAGTAVLSLAPAVLLDDVLMQPLPENYLVQFPDIRMLSDRDMSLIRQVLLRSNETTLQRTADKIKQVTDIQSDLPNRTFLETVIRDYQFITAQ